ELEAGDDFIPHFCARLSLSLVTPHTVGGIHEVIYVRLDRLSKLIAKRVAKEELKSVPVEARH
ncbi:MAG: hypothetical protein KDD44_11080, partial [Bdellovibrionales bacterium]|nr:hypothetical protein [Bdellovibrionales bacterium]